MSESCELLLLARSRSKTSSVEREGRGRRLGESKQGSDNSLGEPKGGDRYGGMAEDNGGAESVPRSKMPQPGRLNQAAGSSSHAVMLAICNSL